MEKIKKKIVKIKTWIRKNPKEAAFLMAILLLAAFLRLYKIDQYMIFLGDEGRDAIVVRRLLVDFDPILIGPGTSIGNMYLGPLYYYMMAPALLLARFSPVGPAVQIALLGVTTVFFVWYIGREWFGKVAALVSSFLYAIAPTIIIYSQSSWNPNIMPFFALLTIYSLWQIWQKGKWKWLLVLAVSFAFVLQSHYLGLLLIPAIGIFWFLSWWKIRMTKKTKAFFRYSLYGLVIFFILMSPLVIFDARHGWRNFEALYRFFAQRQTTISARPWNALPKLVPLMQEVTTRLVGARVAAIGKWILLAILATLFWLLAKHRDKLKKIEIRAYYILAVWFFFAFLGLGLYKQEIYDHYFGLFFPAPFLLIGAISEELVKFAKRTGLVIVAILVLYLAYANLTKTPISNPPNRQLQRTKIVAEKIMKEADGERFNLAVIAERNYDDAYQYFLEKWGAEVVDIDAQLADETITDILFVVCERTREDCHPTTDPKSEIANFGWSKIENEWKIEGIYLFELAHAR